MKTKETKKLYRKVNYKGHNSKRYGWYGKWPGHYKRERHTKATKEDIENGITHEQMIRHNRDMWTDYAGDYDFTPLYKYLLKCVGKDWDAVWKEVYERTDHHVDNIQRMVLNINSHGEVAEIHNRYTINKWPSYYTAYENAAFQTLYVDENNTLQVVDEHAKEEWLKYQYNYYGKEISDDFLGSFNGETYRPKGIRKKKPLGQRNLHYLDYFPHEKGENFDIDLQKHNKKINKKKS